MTIPFPPPLAHCKPHQLPLVCAVEAGPDAGRVVSKRDVFTRVFELLLGEDLIVDAAYQRANVDAQPAYLYNLLATSVAAVGNEDACAGLVAACRQAAVFSSVVSTLANLLWWVAPELACRARSLLQVIVPVFAAVGDVERCRPSPSPPLVALDPVSEAAVTVLVGYLRMCHATTAKDGAVPECKPLAMHALVIRSAFGPLFTHMCALC